MERKKVDVQAAWERVKSLTPARVVEAIGRAIGRMDESIVELAVLLRRAKEAGMDDAVELVKKWLTGPQVDRLLRIADGTLPAEIFFCFEKRPDLQDFVAALPERERERIVRSGTVAVPAPDGGAEEVDLKSLDKIKARQVLSGGRVHTVEEQRRAQEAEAAEAANLKVAAGGMEVDPERGTACCPGCQREYSLTALKRIMRALDRGRRQTV